MLQKALVLYSNTARKAARYAAGCGFFVWFIALFAPAVTIRGFLSDETVSLLGAVEKLSDKGSDGLAFFVLMLGVFVPFVKWGVTVWEIERPRPAHPAILWVTKLAATEVFCGALFLITAKFNTAGGSARLEGGFVLLVLAWLIQLGISLAMALARAAERRIGHEKEAGGSDAAPPLVGVELEA